MGTVDFGMNLHSNSAFFVIFCTHIVHFLKNLHSYSAILSKGKRQIADAKEGYVVKDDIEYGYGNVIPLWAFGLNY